MHSFDDHKNPPVPVAASNAQQRFTRNAVSVPGRLLIRLALLSAGVLAVANMLGAALYGGAGWWIMLVIAAAALACTGFFAYRRYSLAKAIARSGPREVVTVDDSSSEPAQRLQEAARQTGERIGSARAEYSRRTARFFPRIEAAQRSLRHLLAPDYDAQWLNQDFRYTLASFVLTAVSIPITGALTLITAVGLLIASIG
ncbi:hypothetical protein [Gleimia hominis]|uniref:hypothetical protein n=1 Tax=Gleimia hominis TaxID=595468 RepID=UPI0011AEF264|nr:hypothetical protein [Gleimia hominis]WIK64893.1 hypothetical protein CJ187_002205 [Gleimia hominis]